jgi:hypothetical protein
MGIRVRVVLALAVVATLLAAPRAEAQAANNLADALDLGSALATADFGHNLTAGAEPGEPAHAGVPATQSVWLKWTAPSNVSITLDTCHVSNFDTVIEVYWGPAVGPTFANITSIASNDDGCGSTPDGSQVKFAANQGVTYYFVVDTADVNSGNTYSISLRASPVNDDFSGTTLASTAPLRATGTNDGATKEPGEPNHAGNPGGASVWWSWVAPATDNFTIETCASDFDTLLAVYTGGGFTGGITLQVANDDTCGFGGGRVVLPATAGTTYRIAVDGKNIISGAETGSVVLDIAQGVVVADTTPPDTTITSVARKRRTATVSFVGTDNLANGITFECKVDKGAFAFCTSPKSYKLKRGKHTVQVRAIDAAGNVDATPATASVRIRG